MNSLVRTTDLEISDADFRHVATIEEYHSLIASRAIEENITSFWSRVPRHIQLKNPTSPDEELVWHQQNGSKLFVRDNELQTGDHLTFQAVDVSMISAIGATAVASGFCSDLNDRSKSSGRRTFLRAAVVGVAALAGFKSLSNSARAGWCDCKGGWDYTTCEGSFPCYRTVYWHRMYTTQSCTSWCGMQGYIYSLECGAYCL